MSYQASKFTAKIRKLYIQDFIWFYELRLFVKPNSVTFEHRFNFYLGTFLGSNMNCLKFNTVSLNLNSSRLKSC